MNTRWPLIETFRDPPREFGILPFWFLNDDLDEAEIARQLADFEAHGVYGVIFHPRVGLPRDIGWMSQRMLYFLGVTVAEAKRRDMRVMLYDEGMYPSGSSAGQVVAANSDYQSRCLAMRELRDGEDPAPAVGENLVAVVARQSRQRLAVIDRRHDGYMRGLHYADHDVPRQPDGAEPPEDEHPVADLLNPDAVATFIRLVYDKFAECFADEFGQTIVAMFTDEPSMLGKPRGRARVWPGTTGILEHVNALLGYDFEPHLPALWFDDEPGAEHYRGEYQRAIENRLQQTYYAQIFHWCQRHGLPLTGHPTWGDDIGPQRYLHIPGQDSVWREVLPASALEGKQSTQAKCTSSAMAHFRRRRNMNECCGVYGHELTWQEMKWLANWCFVRGVNMLCPHAFFYSVRGARIDERPPCVGPNSPWWDRYKLYADYCRRMSCLNTDCQHVCHVAILGQTNFLPWRAARVCFQHQRDFNYLEDRHLWEDADVDEHGIRLADMHYDLLIIDGIDALPNRAQPAIELLESAGRVVRFAPGREAKLLDTIDRHVPSDLALTPHHHDVRYRHVIKNGHHFYIICNEGLAPVSAAVRVSVKGRGDWLDPLHNSCEPAGPDPCLSIAPYTTLILHIPPNESPPSPGQQRKRVNVPKLD